MASRADQMLIKLSRIQDTSPIPDPYLTHTLPTPYPYSTHTLPIPHPYLTHTSPIPYPYPILSCSILFQPILSYLIPSHPTPSYSTLSILSYPILSHLILPYPILPSSTLFYRVRFDSAVGFQSEMAFGFPRRNSIRKQHQIQIESQIISPGHLLYNLINNSTNSRSSPPVGQLCYI